MTETAKVIPMPAPGGKDLYEVGEIPPLGHVPAKMYAWAIRRERHGEPEKAMQLEVVPTPALDRLRGAGHGDGRGRQLQRRLGRARPADLALRRAQGALSHRRLGCRRRGLGGRRQGEALEGRRRGRHPLQPGRRRRRGMQRRRSRCSRPRSASGATRRRTAPSPSSPRVQAAAAHAAAAPPDLGRERLLHADARHRLPHAVRPPPAYPAARPQRAGLGRFGRHRLDGGAAHLDRRRQRHRRHLRRRQARFRHAARRQGRHQPQQFRLLGPAARRRRRRGLCRLHEEVPRVRQGDLGRSPARATTSISCSSIRASRPSRSPASW